MTRLVAPDDAGVVAVTEALVPDGWRTLTPDAACRRRPPPDRWGAGVACRDERIEVLSDFLADCPWRSPAAAGLSRRRVTGGFQASSRYSGGGERPKSPFRRAIGSEVASLGRYGDAARCSGERFGWTGLGSGGADQALPVAV